MRAANGSQGDAARAISLLQTLENTPVGGVQPARNPSESLPHRSRNAMVMSTRAFATWESG